MTTDEEYAKLVRAAAAWCAGKGPEWGVVTHENPFGDRGVSVAPIGAVWEKHGVSARDQCATCDGRRLSAELDIATEALAPDEDADALSRPLEEALHYGE